MAIASLFRARLLDEFGGIHSCGDVGNGDLLELGVAGVRLMLMKDVGTLVWTSLTKAYRYADSQDEVGMSRERRTHASRTDRIDEPRCHVEWDPMRSSILLMMMRDWFAGVTPMI